MGSKAAQQRLPARLSTPRRIRLLCATLAAPILQAAMSGLEAAIEGLTIEVVPVVNEFYGPSSNVSGLLVGERRTLSQTRSDRTSC
ncbi:MAG: DUF512 domain-containing protein [Chloroflexia bacterium]